LRCTHHHPLSSTETVLDGEIAPGAEASMTVPEAPYYVRAFAGDKEVCVYLTRG